MLILLVVIMQLFIVYSEQQDDSKNRDNMNSAHSNGFSVVVIRFDYSFSVKSFISMQNLSFQ